MIWIKQIIRLLVVLPLLWVCGTVHSELPPQVADQDAIRGYWQCVGGCMPECTQNASIIPLAQMPSNCEVFCKGQCNPNNRTYSVKEFAEEAFKAIISNDENDVQSFEISSFTDSINCPRWGPCRCSGADDCNIFIAVCAGASGTPICLDHDEIGRPIRCLCY